MVGIFPQDDVYVRIECDDAIARELYDYFTFEQPGAAFMRRQSRFKRWDGRIRLFKLRTRTIYRGLVPRIQEFCKQRDYSCFDHTPIPLDITPDACLKTLNLPFAPKDYQEAALRSLLSSNRGIVLSPTGSGKSFIIYLLTRVLNTKTLVVVPSIGLVSQMAQDFQSYGFNLDELHTIQAGRDKQSDAGLFISTWQSIYKLPSEYFAQFDCIIVDEVHQAKAKSLTHLMEKAVETPFRFGFTGSLDDSQAHQLILEGLFGPITRVATTKQLQQRNELAKLHINMLVLKYPEDVCKRLRKAQYQDEIDYIVTDLARLEFVVRLAKSLKGNALFLFNYVEKHGKPLYERMKAVCTDKQVHFIAGEVEGETREDIRSEVSLALDGDGHNVVASFGTFSTGVNIPNLRHLVLASPSKSKIRIIQSIGRSLRLHESKSHATLWDIVDDLSYGKVVNYALRHAEERVNLYATEKFPVALKKIALPPLMSLYTSQREDQT